MATDPRTLLLHRLQDAVTSESWDMPLPESLQGLADCTFNYFEFTIIVNELFKILVNKRAHWLTLFKGLAVLDFLLLNGSEDTIAECRGRMRDLEALLDFKYVDPEEDTDVGISVREAAKQLIELLHDERRLQAERQHVQGIPPQPQATHTEQHIPVQTPASHFASALRPENTQYVPVASPVQQAPDAPAYGYAYSADFDYHFGDAEPVFVAAQPAPAELEQPPKPVELIPAVSTTNTEQLKQQAPPSPSPIIDILSDAPTTLPPKKELTFSELFADFRPAMPSFASPELNQVLTDSHLQQPQMPTQIEPLLASAPQITSQPPQVAPVSPLSPAPTLPVPTVQPIFVPTSSAQTKTPPWNTSLVDLDAIKTPLKVSPKPKVPMNLYTSTTPTGPAVRMYGDVLSPEVALPSTGSGSGSALVPHALYNRPALSQPQPRADSVQAPPWFQPRR